MNRQKWMTIWFCAALLITPALLVAVPYTFSSGQPILASQMSANFAALESEIQAVVGAAPARTNLIRVSAGPTASGFVRVCTVPSSATQPYLLREVLGGGPMRLRRRTASPASR